METPIFENNDYYIKRTTTYDNLLLLEALAYTDLTLEDIEQGPALGDLLIAATKASSYKDIKTLSYFFYGIVEKLVASNCFGCQNDRPSQHEHNCSGWDYYDPYFQPVTAYFTQAVKSITRAQLREHGGDAINMVLDKYQDKFKTLCEWLGEIYYKHLEITYTARYETSTCHCMNCLFMYSSTYIPTNEHPGRPEA